ncbi:DUF2471 family protein [Paraburkholderia humisilvae]|uniref:Uncharacterized protein n=1 Tax=Paraburkholderia humisilvae TaxID=627669 RepID=A0A6J5F6S0_9BURK|nr:DUF2471 family protein [Paraburkholderia humisilvae]CAB3774194.1 hypothetical protein LMG29542_07641 [Paraburkholderia humisilvae]
MVDPGIPNNRLVNVDVANFERAVGRAMRDLEHIVVVLLEDVTRTNGATTWRMLRAIDEQAFGDLGFQSRHDGPVRAVFVRVEEYRLTAIDYDTQVNWSCDDTGLPAVYLIARRFFGKPRK